MKNSPPRDRRRTVATRIYAYFQLDHPGAHFAMDVGADRRLRQAAAKVYRQIWASLTREERERVGHG